MLNVSIITNMPVWNMLKLRMFPPSCLFCQQPVSQYHSCCAECLPSIYINSPFFCNYCGTHLSQVHAPGPCGACLKRKPPQCTTQSLYQYRGAVRQAILQWKLAGQDAAMLWLLKSAQTQLRQSIHPDDLLLPIPMPLRRMRQAGMHHAADCCRAIATICQCDMQWRLLRRKGLQERQSALPAGQRRTNLRKAFYVDLKYIEEVRKYRKVWLVDDIITTGTTMHEASRCMNAHQIDVHAWSLARTSLIKS